MMMKRSIFVIAFFSLAPFLFSFMAADKSPQKMVKTIIVDAGHGLMPGGGHNGAKGSYSYEDDICLAVAKELVSQLHEALPDVHIIETRPNPEITSLYRRADIANENKGDLFVSIHCNAAPPIRHHEFAGYKNTRVTVGKGKKKRTVTKKVAEYNNYTTPNNRSGTETYIWGAHKNEDKEVAVRENAPMLQEEDYKEKYGDIDPNSPEFIALSLLKTKQFFKRSATLAGFVEDEFAKAGRSSRGQMQRQVGIWVLQATAMPSVLVETGYITNKSEEDYLNSKDGQVEIARCVTNAVSSYVNWLDKSQQPSSNDSNSKNDKSPTPRDSHAFLDMIEAKEHSLQ
jgi:N-acetylmuramoyl-L-alanine amidase